MTALNVRNSRLFVLREQNIAMNNKGGRSDIIKACKATLSE